MDLTSKISSQGENTAGSPSIALLHASKTNIQRRDHGLENQLLLCCARTYIAPETADQIETLLHAELDWDTLIQGASRHGVMPLLYNSLNNTCPEAVPQATLCHLQRDFNANFVYNVFLAKELLKVLNLITSNGIPAVPFKGPVLAASIYGNLALRQITDLDILVDQHDFPTVTQLLLAQGYQLRLQVPWEWHFVQDEKGYSIDLHREIVPKHLSGALNSNDIQRSLESFPLQGTPIPNLSPEIGLIVLCLNGTKECWRVLARICDVAELIRVHQDMDWTQIMVQARRLRCHRLLCLGLLLAKDLVGAPLSEVVWQQVQLDPVVKSLALQVCEQLFSEIDEPINEVERTLFHISTREHWQDKIQSFLGLMHHSGWMTPTEKDRNFLVLPASLSFLYCLIRPIRVLRTYGLKPLRHLLGL